VKSILLVGGSADALEAKRVVLEGAGFAVHVLAPGESVRHAAEETGVALVMMDASAGGPDVRRALEELSSSDAPSSTPVVTIGGADVLRDFDGPSAAVERPPRKRDLLESARSLITAEPRRWSRRTNRPS
jgi:DNA-binding NtrC family response regulator